MDQIINFPQHLTGKRLPYLNNNPLRILGEKYRLGFFKEVDYQVLKKCYFDDIILFMKVIRQLAFYGVIFTGNLSKYSGLKTREDSLYLWKETREGQVFNPPIPRHALQKVKEYGVLFEEDAVGIPLLSFHRLDKEFSFENALMSDGYIFLTYNEMMGRFRESSQQLPDNVSKNDTDEVISQTVIAQANLDYNGTDTEDFAHRPAIPDKLKSIGYATWEQVLGDIQKLTERLSDNGQARIEELRQELMQLQDKIESIETVNKDVLDTYLKLRVDGVVFEIPSAFKDKLIAFVDFPTCPQVPKKLNMLGYIKWGQLPFELDVLLKNIPGIGPKAINKFVATAQEMFKTAEGEATLTKISYRQLQLTVPAEKLNDSLTFLADYRFLAVPILDALHALGLRTISSLPRNLEILEQQLPKSQVFQLFDSLCRAFATELTLEARIHKVIFSILETTKKQSKKSKRAFEILLTKFNLLKEKKNPKLKDVSQVIGVSRERTRQILSRFWHKELLKQNNLFAGVLDNINCLGGLVPLDKSFAEGLLSLSLFEQFIVREVFVIFDLMLTEQNYFLTTLPKREYKNVFKELEADLQRSDKLPLSQAMIERTVLDFVVKRGFHFACQEALLRLVYAHMLIPWQNGYLLKSLPKSEKIICILKEYPKGLAIHKDFTQFFNRLDEVFPGEFNQNDRYIYSSILNSEKAFLWGWGIYIHRDNVDVAKEDLEEIVAWIKRQFADGVEKLSINAPFQEFKDYMDIKGIPNEHALYSCLRYFYPETFYMPKSPYIYAHYIDEQQNTAILETFIQYSGKNMAYSELRDEFVGRRGWKEYTLNQAITLSPRVIRTARAEYGLLDFYPLVTKEKLEPLAQFLQSRLSQDVQQVNIRLVYINKQVTCNQLQIGSEVALYSLMERYFANRFNFPQYPHVQLKLLDACVETSNVKQLDEYMRNIGNSIFKSELRQEFMGRRGWTDKAIENALRTNANVYVLQRGSAAEYVHADVIGWNKNKQDQLEAWIKDCLAEFKNGPVPYGSVKRDLFKPQHFPKLDAGVAWTEDLLKELLKNCSFIEFIGTLKAIFVPIPNKYEINDDVGFLEFIVREEFKGRAKTAQLQERLAELNFSYNGEIKQSYKDESADLPFLFTEDETILKDLHQRSIIENQKEVE